MKAKMKKRTTQEDASDLAAIRARAEESSRAYEAVLKDLKKDGFL